MALFKTSFTSYTLKRNVDINIMYPGLTPDEISHGAHDHAMKGTPPVLYLLHGYWGSHNSWNSYSSVERYAEEYQIVIVTLSAENNSYVNLNDFIPKISDKLFPADYYAFVEDEISNFVHCFFPVSRRKEDTYIAGLSMGGYGAMIHGLAHAEKYQAVGAFSPVTTLQNGRLGDFKTMREEVKTKYEPIEIIKKAKNLPAFYYSYGTLDYLLSCQDWFEEELQKLNIAHTCNRRDGFRHEWKLWDEELDNFLKWIPRTDAFASLPKRFV